MTEQEKCTVCGEEVKIITDPWVTLDEAGAVIKGAFCSRGCLYEYLLNETTHEASDGATPRREAVEPARSTLEYPRWRVPGRL